MRPLDTHVSRTCEAVTMTSGTTRARTTTTKTAFAFLLPGGDVHQQTSIVQIRHGDFLVCHAMPSTVTTDTFYYFFTVASPTLMGRTARRVPASPSTRPQHRKISWCGSPLYSVLQVQPGHSSANMSGLPLPELEKPPAGSQTNSFKHNVKVKKKKGRWFRPSLVCCVWSAWSRPEGPAPK